MKYKLLVISLLALLASCTQINDYELLQRESFPSSWQEELNCQIQLNQSVLDNSNVHLKQYELFVDDIEIDSFLNTNEICFPIYSNGLESFHLLPYDLFKNDTVNFHVSSNIVEKNIDNIIKEKDKYQFVRLTWGISSREFHTIAVFNLDNHDFVYDNLLCNIIVKREMMTRSSPFALTIGESTQFQTIVNFGVSFADRQGYTLASSHMYAEVEYGWDAHEIIENSRLVGYYYTYRHRRLTVRPVTWIEHSYENRISVISDYEDQSTTNKTRIKYCVWAGPIEYQPNNPVDNISLNDDSYDILDGCCPDSSFLWHDLWYRGRIETVTFAPSHQPTFIN